MPRDLEPNWSGALPADILRSIFSFCLDDRSSWCVLPPTHSTDPRTILLHVCSFWRAVALGAAELWSNVIVNLDSMPLDIVPMVHEVLSRTNGALLKVIVRMRCFQNHAPLRPSVDEFLDKIVVPFAQSLKTLELFVPFPFVKPILTLLHSTRFPALEAFSLRQASVGAIVSYTFCDAAASSATTPCVRLPCLKTVEFNVRCSISLLEDRTSFPAVIVPWSQLTTFVFLQVMPVKTLGDILSLCPSLKSCGVHLENLGGPPSWFSQLTLPHLERLHLRSSHSAQLDLFLKTCFQLPSIRDLALKESEGGVGWTPILGDFLIDQCGSSLESLFVASAHTHHPIDANTVGFERFVQKHSSTLRELYLPTICWNQPINVGIFRQLVSRELCPHLEKLSLEVYYWPTTGKDRLRIIVDTIKGAECMKRGTLNKLYMFFYHWRRPSRMEPLILDCIKELSHIPTTIYFHIYYSMIIDSADLVTLERNWFGYHA